MPLRWIAAIAFLSAGLSPALTDALGAGDRPVPMPIRPGLQVREAPLSLELVEGLAFGRVVATQRHSGAMGVITIDPRTGEKAVQGQVLNLGGYHSRAEYIVRGKPGTRFAIILPARSVLTGKKGSVSLSDFTTEPLRYGQINAEGKARIYMGASLKIVGKIPAGLYEGFMDLMVKTAGEE